ncbi:four-carbon acid sugar kinase family protein [Virgibacillus dakarensis]|uniref:four-carbon acid sugar kinase family protein n=1 Tax=Virgibacillus dakarensis TaxID=1917889 RepID=UPI00111FB70B|nr:four-carbon acid sugar kinase family protein [Virgibacillus dakarensis]
MKVGVIADDLTGANGTGVKLSKLGFKSITSFERIPSHTPESGIAICLDTDSRYVSPNIAEDRVQHSITQLQAWGAEIICKRIDSTFRGNIGVELDAVLESMDDSVAIIVPSYPSSRRVVVGGYMLVNGVLLHETDVAKDPIHPITDSYLPAILGRQTDNHVGYIELKKVSLGTSVIAEQLNKVISEGNRFIICDAVTDEQIEAIANAMVTLKDKRFIPVDPGPLTEYFVRKLNQSNPKDEPKILVSVGSVTSVIQNQLQYFIKETQVTPVYVRPDRLVTFSSSWDEEIHRVVEVAKAVMENHATILVTTNHPNQSIVNFKQIASTEGVSEVRLAKRITNGLAEISKQLILANESIKGCFFSGGDITASFCGTAKVEGINLIDEVMPLAAFGEIMGGKFDGLAIVTKGGLVGGNTAIFDSVEYIKQHINNKGRTFHES